MREREEEARGRELAEAMRSLDAEQARLEELRILEANALAEYHQMQSEGRLDVQAIQWFQSYFMSLTLSIKAQVQRIAEADKVVQQRRAALMAAAQAKQVLSQLKEQAKAEYRKAVDMAEAKLIDEIATLRHARKE